MLVSLLLALGLTSAGASAQEEPETPESKGAERAEALQDELLEWAPAAREGEPGPEPDVPDAPTPTRETPEAAGKEGAATPAPEPAIGRRVGPDEWSIEWRNGVRMRRNDGRYDLHLGGLVQLDAAGFHLDKDLQPRDSGWGFDASLRRARIFAQGVLFNRILFKVDYDLDATEVRDLFVGLQGLPVLGTIQFGYIKEPFSLEQATSSRFNTFLERSLVNALAPCRNTGLVAIDTLLDARLRWEAGVYFVVENFGASDRSDLGFDKDWDLGFRVTALPIYEDYGRCLFLAGVSYNHRFADNENARFSSPPESRLIDALIETPALLSVEDIDTVGLELAWVDGPLSMQGEFIHASVSRADGLSDYVAWGGYVQASLFLTGEQRQFGRASGKWGRIVPKEEFDWGQRQLGAVEIAARLSHLDLDDGRIRGGRQTNTTLGLNWYLLSNIRIGVNVI